MTPDVLYEALFQAEAPRPVDVWAVADGSVSLTTEGHLLVVKADRWEDIWDLVTRTSTNVAHKMRPGAGESYLRRVWDLEDPLRRFILASLVTDARAHKMDEPLETSQFGSVRIAYSNAGWDKEQVRKEARAVLDRIQAGAPPVTEMGAEVVLSLDRRQPGIG